METGSALHIPDYLIPLFGKYACYALLALSLDLVWGYVGILSLGHGAFFALGGYAFGMYLMRSIGNRGVYGNSLLPDFMVFLNWKELPWYWYGFDNFGFAVLMALAVPGLLAFVFGWFAFRSRITGVYLSIITQAMTFALMLAFFRNEMGFGGNNGLTESHGEMIMLGAYTTFVVQEVFRSFLPPQLLDLYLIAAIPVAFMVAGGVGMLLERLVISRLYSRPLETLLATWGISLILQQLVRSIFGAPNKEVANPAWMTGGFEIGGGIVLTYNRFYIILFCLLVLGAIAFVIRKSSFGLNVRAVTQNREMASTMGIHTGWVDTLTFGLGSGIAGMGGVALSQIGNVSPNLGQLYIVDSFMVVVFGGVGNLAGTLVGAMTLGVINKFLEPVSGAVLGKVIVLVMIILFIQRRPQGLFALRGRAAGN